MYVLLNIPQLLLHKEDISNYDKIAFTTFSGKIQTTECAKNSDIMQIRTKKTLFLSSSNH